MDTNFLNLQFNGCYTKIQLLDTPVVGKWLSTYNKYKSYFTTNNLDLDYKIEPQKTIIHFSGESPDYEGTAIHPMFLISASECVDKINLAIEEANSSIEGKKFPYKAYLGMPWGQTNLIHRCFTTSLMTGSNWQHNLTTSELLKFKKLAYEGKPLQDFIKEKQFLILDHTKFFDAIERINKYVHIYESFYISERALETTTYIGGTGNYLELGWDSYSTSGDHIFYFGEKISYSELCQSFPDNTEDHDVFLAKSIAGKDYEFAFCEYDNPLEYDITNLDTINGSVRIHFSDDINKLYNDSPFVDWCKNAGIEYNMFHPVPIGKIVENSCEFSSLQTNYDSDFRWSNGGSRPYPPFDTVRSWISSE